MFANPSSSIPLFRRTFLGGCDADNYVHDMNSAGIALMESMNASIYNNVVEDVMYGVRLSVGASGNKIYDNTFDNCLDSKSSPELR